MGTTKRIVPWPPAHLEVSQCYNNADALADIISTLAGNAAALKGYIDGGDKIDDDTPNTAPLSPGQSLPGHDHSGGLYGRPLFISLANISLDDFQSYASTYISNAAVSNTCTLGATANQIKAVTLGTFPVWIPGCDPGQYGAYQNLAVAVRCQGTTATNIDSGDVLSVKITNQTADGSRAVVTKTQPTATNFGLYSTSTQSTRLRTVPGRPNLLSVSVEFDTSVVAATRVLVVDVLEIELGVFST